MPVALSLVYKTCNSCEKERALQRYSCTSCEWHICIECADLLYREIHIARYGAEHQMIFTRVARNCNVCQVAIREDFTKCVACFSSYDMCIKCVATARISTSNPLGGHMSTYGSSHSFRQIDWDASTPIKQPITVDIPDSNAYKCNWCQIFISGIVLSCLECNARSKLPENLCCQCADKGKLSRHIKRTGHHFVLFNLRNGGEVTPVVVVEASDPPPPYTNF